MSQCILKKTLSSLNREDFPSAQNILLVTGRASYEASGARKEMERIFAGCNVHRFSDFETNPQLEDLEKGIHIFKEHQIDLIIAVGGGSALDMAKLLSVLPRAPHKPADYITGRIALPESVSFPLAALPTTSGSGSESTHFAVVYMDKVKYSLAHPDLLPGLVVLDPELTLSMSPYQTACSGLDALAQAVESYWCVNADTESRTYASRALALILEHFVSAVNQPDLNNKRAMQEAANLAGQAINITKTTGPHAFCYYLTSHYGIPHGHAAALMLIPFIIYNSRMKNPEIQKVLSALYTVLGVKTAEEASDLVRNLMESVRLPVSLKEIMNLDTDIEAFYASVNLERLKNNPRPMENKEEFFELLL